MICPFCDRIASGELIAANNLAAALADVYPVSPGHTLIVPRRHEADFLALSADERRAILDLLNPVRDELAKRHQPAGYNVGINIGCAAGQTVPHAHLHVIPRYKGDVPDPRGGIRHVIPGKGFY